MSADRRTFIAGGLALAAIATGATAATAQAFESKRPPLADRKFTSCAVEREVRRISAAIGDPELRWMFANCYPNTLDTTVFMDRVDGKPDAFVITGDIECLWLRDSSAQLNPYLHLTREDAVLR